MSNADAVRIAVQVLDRELVLLTDDPDLAPIRAASLLYEYLPVADVGERRFEEERLLHLQRVYGTARPVRVESLAD